MCRRNGRGRAKDRTFPKVESSSFPCSLEYGQSEGKPVLNSQIMSHVIERANMKTAWHQVKANGGACGVDGVTTDAFPDFIRKKWPKMKKGLLEGNYIPRPVRRVEIPKKSGGKRQLGIPTVKDRLIQQAISQILTPIFDPGFSESSFGFRPKRSAHMAVYQMQNYVNKGYHWVVDLDLEKFFDNINHDILMSLVAKKVRDKTLLKLIGRYLRAGVMIGKTIHPSRQGTPQGGPLSPLLGNVLLDKLDKELESRNLPFCRYADDIRIFARTKDEAVQVMKWVCSYIEKKLKLKVSPSKSKVAHSNKSSFLGFTMKGSKIRWTEESFSQFKYTIKKLTGRSNGISLEKRIYRLNTYIRGWMNYYGISQYYTPIQDIDGWLRRRLRMCMWKQWRYVRTRVRNLIKLGVPKKMAIDTGISSKSFWKLSKTFGTNFGMGIEWFNSQGLVNIKKFWCIAQGYTV